MTPAFTSSSLYFAMPASIFSLGISPASDASLAFTIMMKRMSVAPYLVVAGPHPRDLCLRDLWSLGDGCDIDPSVDTSNERWLDRQQWFSALVCVIYIAFTHGRPSRRRDLRAVPALLRASVERPDAPKWRARRRAAGTAVRRRCRCARHD